FGKPRDDEKVETILRQLSLWDKKDAQIRALSGGMKRRVLIAKALAHEPRLLFLDEPTAGVDVELRKDMWDIVARLKSDGVTIVLTTHYIEEAEAIADRIGIIANGRLLLVEEKSKLMARMGKKHLRLTIAESIERLPPELDWTDMQITQGGSTLVYTYVTQGERTGITRLLSDMAKAGLTLRDVATQQSSLEDIFVDLVQDNGSQDAA
ncbi:MAG TPA: ABC transporter ATP-binding protein, partial [Paracoccaceae bacterium]|nr:ABC transporter ATP-binding protein [Paracoccaceae bacterium]